MGKKERERERERELLALVQFEVFSGQYLISTNRTKNDVTTIVYDIIACSVQSSSSFLCENVTIFSILTVSVQKLSITKLKTFKLSILNSFKLLWINLKQKRWSWISIPTGLRIILIETAILSEANSKHGWFRIPKLSLNTYVNFDWLLILLQDNRRG